MAGAGKGGVPAKKTKVSPSLSELAHTQIMDYLRLAEQSRHPEIRAAAVDIAKTTSRHQLKQTAKVSPTLILWVDMLLGVAAALGCWYAYLHYPEPLATHITGIIIRVYLVVAGISLLLSGHLSQANLMKIFGWLESQAKAKLTSLRRTPRPNPEQSTQSDHDDAPVEH